MLIKRTDLMTTVAQNVKKMGTSLVGLMALSAAFIAPAAHADDSLLYDQVVTVTFKVSELNTGEGTEKVYAKLTKRAKSFCRADTPSLSYLGESVDDCTADLIEQFIQSADVPELKAYHLAQSTVIMPKKVAALKK